MTVTEGETTTPSTLQLVARALELPETCTEATLLDRLDSTIVSRADLAAATTRISELLDVDLGLPVEQLPDRVQVLRDTLAETSPLAAQVPALKTSQRTLFGLSARLMAQLAWCAGFLEGDEQKLPDSLQATIDDAVRTLSSFGNVDDT